VYHRSSLRRTYADISQDTLDYSNQPAWPTLLYSVAFLHTVVQERRKYGPLGWNIPYEFNRADFTASYQFMMNHLDDLDPKRGISWQTVQFMLAEVQYGGRVTDDYDKRLLRTFTSVWFNPELLTTDFKFFEGYSIPDCRTVEEYAEFISSLPLQDIPEVFGLHANADITYQINTAAGILDQILDVQPKEAAGGKGESRETVVKRLAEGMQDKLPLDYSPHEVTEAIEELGGMLPMNIFLR
jgi:dynein heavy chain